MMGQLFCTLTETDYKLNFLVTYSQFPKLTLPPLQDTLAKFVAFAKPIQGPSQFDETCKVGKELFIIK